MHTHPCLYRWTPCFHLISLRESMHWAAGVNRFISLSVVTRNKSLLFPGDLDVSQSPHPRSFITWASLFEKGFKVRGLQISILWFLCPESECNKYSFTLARRGWCEAVTFPQLQLQGRKDCRSLTPPSAKEAIISKPQTLFTSSYFQTIWRRQNNEAKGEMDEKMHKSIYNYSDLSNYAMMW